MERKSKIALVIVGIVYVASVIAGIISAKRNARHKYLDGFTDGVRETTDYFHSKDPDLVID